MRIFYINLRRSADRAVTIEAHLTGLGLPAKRIEAVDGTAAGDAFTAALALGLAGGLDDEAALRRACVVGALTTTRAGAQPALPTTSAVDQFTEAR